MFFIHFQFKVAFRAPFPALPPLLLASCGFGETFFGPCPKSVSAMNSNGFAANWQNFLCVCCQSRPQNCCYCFHLQLHAPTSLLPPIQLQQQTKKVQTNYHTNCDKHRKVFIHSARRGGDSTVGGGAATHTPRCLPQFQALPLADVQLTNVKLFLLLNVIDWPLTVD